MLPDFHPVCLWPFGIMSVFIGDSCSRYSLILCGSSECDPTSLLQKGKQHTGSIPLTPSFLEVFINILRAIALLGDARAAGAEARCAGAPKSIHGRRATGTHG